MKDIHTSNDATSSDSDEQTPEEQLLERSTGDITDVENRNVDMPPESQQEINRGGELFDEEEGERSELNIMRDEDSPLSSFPRE